jgi:hypothetical protein
MDSACRVSRRLPVSWFFHFNLSSNASPDQKQQQDHETPNAEQIGHHGPWEIGTIRDRQKRPTDKSDTDAE